MSLFRSIVRGIREALQDAPAPTESWWPNKRQQIADLTGVAESEVDRWVARKYIDYRESVKTIVEWVQIQQMIPYPV